MDNFWHLGDELRGQVRVSEDHHWSVMTSKLAEMTGTKSERMNNVDPSRSSVETKMKEKFGFQEEIKFENFNFTMPNLDNETIGKTAFYNSMYNMNTAFLKSNDSVNNFKLNDTSSKLVNSSNMKESYNNNSNNIIKNSSSNSNNNNGSPDKRFKTLPSTEMLPRNEVLGGYIFVCNNDTMQEDLKRQLFDHNVLTK
ncbi:hypothetical protein Taro_035300 [Colocasia esculenta]|uniref:DCD domain-containing protein n=1 Tax=Colocasia esculenta TaxID=4460 RepID=A0A843VU15_COLES|nr:hypothetical protein [Colocasia esculenta]